MYKTDPITLGVRLTELWQDQRDKKNLDAKSSRSFALSIGADPSYFARAEKGKGFSDDYIEAVVSKYGVNEEWLRYGRGEMYGQNSPKNVSHGTAEVQTISPAQASKIDLTELIAQSIKDQKEIDRLREENRSKDTENISRLITLLENQQAVSHKMIEQEISLLKKDNHIHYSHHSSLRHFVLEVASQLRGTDHITQRIALSRLESVALNSDEGIYMPESESDGKKHSRKKTEKAD